MWLPSLTDQEAHRTEKKKRTNVYGKPKLKTRKYDIVVLTKLQGAFKCQPLASTEVIVTALVIFWFLSFCPRIHSINFIFPKRALETPVRRFSSTLPRARTLARSDVPDAAHAAGFGAQLAPLQLGGHDLTLSLQLPGQAFELQLLGWGAGRGVGGYRGGNKEALTWDFRGRVLLFFFFW